MGFVWYVVLKQTENSPLCSFLGLIVLSVDVELVLECVLPVRSFTNDRRAPVEPPPPPPPLLFGDMGAVSDEAVAVEGLATLERCTELLTTTTVGSL